MSWSLLVVLRLCPDDDVGHSALARALAKLGSGQWAVGSGHAQLGGGGGGGEGQGQPAVASHEQRYLRQYFLRSRYCVRSTPVDYATLT